MHTAVGADGERLLERLATRGVSRRRFLQWCGAVAAVMGLEGVSGLEVAHALVKARRPSVIYLHLAECTGCSEALLRSPEPTIDTLLFDVISLDYHETLMAASGHKAEAALEAALHSPEGFYCIVEGAIPTGDGGLYGYVGGKTMLDLCAEVLPKAKAVLAYGTCACFGGIQAAAPNPTDALGVNACFAEEGIEAINIAGCPPNPINLVGAIVALLRGDPLPLDKVRRPLMFYGVTVHEQCERREHFDAARFAPSFESEEARAGWCLYKLGCRGPMTLNNCPKALFNETNWPVKAGHPCIGCSEPGFWDLMTPFYDYSDRKGRVS